MPMDRTPEKEWVPPHSLAELARRGVRSFISQPPATRKNARSVAPGISAEEGPREWPSQAGGASRAQLILKEFRLQ